MDGQGQGNIVWMFQYQLKWYDLKAELAAGKRLEDWQAIQHASKMRIGQEVFLLRAGGDLGRDARQIEAVGRIDSELYPAIDREGRPYYKVNVLFLAEIVPPLTRSEMLQDAVLGSYEEFTEGRQGTNFILPGGVATRTREITRLRLRPLSPEGILPTPNEVKQVGHAYVPAALSPIKRGLIQTTMDPTKMEQAVHSHANLQNEFASYLRRSGLQPLSPRADEPPFDLAASFEGQPCVIEVKSISVENEESQLRLGLGQVLIYRHLLARRYGTMGAVLYIGRELTNPCWAQVCADARVLLIWPELIKQDGALSLIRKALEMQEPVHVRL